MSVEAPVFADELHPPSDLDLEHTLGPAWRHWKGVLAQVAELSPAAKPEWKYYSAKSGWTLVVRGKKRNLLYLTPAEQHFRASLAFSEKAVAAAEGADLPSELLEQIRSAPQYPEGRPVRIEVRSPADAKLAKELLAIKVAN